MPSTDLSVSELARMTGLAIGPAWGCATAAAGSRRISLWCSPEWNADSLLNAAPTSLPVERAVRVERRGGSAAWDAEWSLALDLHWLREITPGFPLGVRPVRVHLSSPARARVQVNGEFITLAWRAATGDVRLQAALDLRSMPPSVALEADPALSLMPAGMDEMLRALTGSTPVEWLRGLFADSCSLRWRKVAERIGARLDQLDDLGVYFRALTTIEEDALWRAAASAEDLMELRPWVESLASEQANSFEDLLDAELRRAGPGFWRSSAGRWLNAMAGSAPAGWNAPEVFARLAAAARKLPSLFVRDDLAGLLVRLRATADEEWKEFSPWYRARIEESCGVLSADTSSERVVDEVRLWIKKLHLRLHQRSVDAALRRAKEALSRAVTALVCRDVRALVLADLSIARAEESDHALNRILDGDLRPGLDASSGVGLLGGLLSDHQGRQISLEALMPLLDKRSWATEREALAAAEIVSDGEGQLTLRTGNGAGVLSLARQSAERLLCTVFTSGADAPADDMIHSVVENRRTLLGNETDFAWLRLARAYGLPVPEQTAMPCEATIRIEIPGSWAEAWRRAPFKRNAGYFDKVMRFSMVMQEMARYWLPALSITEAHQFDSPNTVWPLLVFAASRPHADRRKAEFGYDAMSPFRVERAAESALRGLAELLNPLYRRLKASGRSDTAELYSPDRARLIVSAVQRRPRRLQALLAGDTFQLEQCLQLAIVCRELNVAARQNPTQALRKLVKWSKQIAKASQRRLERHSPRPACDCLAAAYLLEATRTLAEGPAGAGFRASLTLESTTGVQRFEAAA